MSNSKKTIKQNNILINSIDDLKNKKVYCNNILIASRIIHCNTFFKKGSGLMFRSKNSVKDTAWVFTFKKSRRISVTMFFVFFPIDLLFIDSKGKIIELKKNLSPFSNYTTKTAPVSFIELDSGTISKYSLRSGQIIRFK